MFKGFLCLIIIFSCGGLGILKSQVYSQRLEELRDLKEMIRILQTEMSYLKDPLPAVFARVGSYKDNRAMGPGSGTRLQRQLPAGGRPDCHLGSGAAAGEKRSARAGVDVFPCRNQTGDTD